MTSPEYLSRYGIFPLTEADRGEFIAHMLRLDSQARARRFGAPIADSQLIAMCERFPLNNSCSWGLFIWGELRGAVQVLAYPERTRAEMAISLAPELRGRGWGKNLTLSALECAHAVGVTCMEINYQRENVAMARICGGLPGSVVASGCEATKLVDLVEWAKMSMTPNHWAQQAA